MKRIGIMGGTFNPIHNGHLAIAGQAKEQFLLDKVLFMPSGVSYMKNQQEILPACVRCEMTALAIRDIPGFELSDMEAVEDTNTYTSHTPQKLKALHPETNYYFILGADSLYALETWRCPELIFQNCTILAAVRKRQDFTDLSMQDMKEQAAGAVTVSSAKISCFCRNTGYRQHRRFLFPDPRSPAKERDDTRPCTRGGGGLYYQKSAVSKLINKKSKSVPKGVYCYERQKYGKPGYCQYP